MRIPRFSLRPKQFALCQMRSNIMLQGLSWAKVDPSVVVSLNYSRPTLNLLNVREEFCHWGLQSANNKGTDQLAHPRSLISAFDIYKLNSNVFKLAPSETSLFYLVSDVAEKAGFGMILSETVKTGFVASMLIYAFIFMSMRTQSTNLFHVICT